MSTTTDLRPNSTEAPVIVAREFRGVRKPVTVVAIALAIIFVSLSGPYSPVQNPLSENLKWIGTLLIVSCIFGRLWCTLYIGGHKNSKLVMVGPYSICRNPLYGFSIIGAVGVGAQFGSLVLAVASGVFTWIVVHRTALREEGVLALEHPDEYPRYLARVPKFLPKPSLWHSPATLVVHTRNMTKTFVDGLIFLTAIPLAWFIEQLHLTGALPVLFTLP